MPKCATLASSCLVSLVVAAESVPLSRQHGPAAAFQFRLLIRCARDSLNAVEKFGRSQQGGMCLAGVLLSSRLMAGITGTFFS